MKSNFCSNLVRKERDIVEQSYRNVTGLEFKTRITVEQNYLNVTGLEFKQRVSVEHSFRNVTDLEFKPCNLIYLQYSGIIFQNATRNNLGYWISVVPSGKVWVV